MNGISLVISKACCPVYSFGTNNKINFGTSTKIDLIPCKLLNLHHQRVSPRLATKSMLKHRVSSSFAGNYETDLRIEEPVVSSAADPYVLLSVGALGMTLVKAWEAIVHFFSTGGGKEAKGFVGNILCGISVLQDKPFSTGDIIEVGYLKGQVLEMGVKTTSLVTAENRRISVPTSWFYGQVIKNKSRTTTVVPYSLVFGQVVVNKPRAPWHEMESTIYLNNEDFDAIPAILEEITNMMRSNPNVYLDENEMEPYCGLSEVKRHNELTIGCYLKQMSEEELNLAKEDVLLQAAQIILKHGAKIGGHKVDVNSLQFSGIANKYY